jgi:hypothetical protein
VPLLAVHTQVDGLLSVLAPLALGASVPTALVLDLDPAGLPLPSPVTVAGLVARGPTLEDLRPAGKGLAVLSSGGAGWEDAADLAEALVEGWPAVVARVPADASLRPLVPVVPLLPGVRPPERPAVFQDAGLSVTASGPGIVLPRPARQTVRRLLSGRRPGGRWIRAWRQVWGAPWT